MIALAIYGFFALSILLAFIFPARWLKSLANLWFGSVLYILFTIAVVDFIRIILKYIIKIPPEILSSRNLFVTAGTLCIIVILSVSSYGYLHARKIQTTKYAVTIQKKCDNHDSLKVVLTADFHLGYNMGNTEMGQMIKKINAQSPDLVLIAGDIFDNDFDAVKDPDRIAETLREIQSTYGVYACYGNHDIQEKVLAGFTFGRKGKRESDPRMDAFLRDSDIVLLKDEGILIDNSFYLIGRADRRRPGRGIDKRKTPSELTEYLDKEKPIFVIDHAPYELEELSTEGVDLDLCGHTHDGQLFPGNLVMKLLWENAYGYLKKGNMHNIVTSGVGVFGPNMRIGTKSEICSITVNFK